MSLMSSLVVLGISVAGVVFSVVAIYYIARLKNGFASLQRLERPWLALECGVASLIIAVITVPWLDASASLDLLQTLAVVLAAFFILTAMVLMKQAWTIGEGD